MGKADQILGTFSMLTFKDGCGLTPLYLSFLLQLSI